MTRIQLDDVTKVFPDGFEAVRHVDLTVDDGELRVLLGPSGCGKSTVLRMIAGLEDPTSGDIRLDGRRVNDAGPRERDVAMAFQQHALYPRMTAAENLGFPLKVAGVHADQIASRVGEVARMLRLDDVLDRRPIRLSGGQQQRVSLGRAIIRSPHLFLMDEPLSHLDSRLRVRSRGEIMQLQRRLATTTVFVTHDQAEAMSMADRITVMRDGAVVQSGAPTDLYRNPVDMFVAQFLGSPPMNLLVATVVRDGEPPGLALAIGSHTVALARPTHPESVIGDALVGRRVGVGIRPESLHPVSDDADLVTSVEFVEPLGSSRLVHASIDAPSVEANGAGVAVARTRTSRIVAFADRHSTPTLWKPFALRVDVSSIHLFDLETGRTLVT